MVKVSIIVPVYKVEPYIEKCLNSLKNQSFDDYEVIVINDGSPDQSGPMAKKICDGEANFHYFEHENRGLGLSRNRGIKLSQGDYIGFVDSDDAVPERMIENLYVKAIESNYDIVCGETVFVYPNEKKTREDKYKRAHELTIKHEYETFFKNYYFTGKYSHHAWDKLYKNSKIKKNDIKFGDNKIVFGEDDFFQLQLLKHVEKIGFINEPVYYYLQREDSIMNSYKENVGQRQLNMVKLLSKENKDKTMEKVFSLVAFDAIVMEVLNVMQAKLSYEFFCKQMDELRQDSYYRKNIKTIVEQRSYQMITHRSKRAFIRIVSFLENNQYYNLANRLIYGIYSRKSKSKDG